MWFYLCSGEKTTMVMSWSRRFQNTLKCRRGTIYPLLNRFKKDGLVDTYLAESHNGPPRKYYRITDAGREEFTESLREWTEFTKAVKKILEEGGDIHE